MLKVRVIPTLLYKSVGLVKGVGFNSWRRVDTVLPAIKVYNMREVDELILLDIEATNEKRDPDYDEIRDFSRECFVPFCVGGGICHIDQIKNLLRAGADKVAINSAAYDNLSLITEGAKLFGSQCIVDGDEEKVYFLTEVSENDLLNTTSDNSETLPKNSAALESAIPVKDAALDNNNTDATGNKKQDAETVEENTEDSTEEGSEPETTEQKQDGSGFSYLIMGIAVAAVIGVVYVIKAKKKKENFIDDDEDELEDDYEEDYDDEDGEEADPDEEFMKNTNAEETNTENEEE